MQPLTARGIGRRRRRPVTVAEFFKCYDLGLRKNVFINEMIGFTENWYYHNHIVIMVDRKKHINFFFFFFFFFFEGCFSTFREKVKFCFLMK